MSALSTEVSNQPPHTVKAQPKKTIGAPFVATRLPLWRAAGFARRGHRAGLALPGSRCRSCSRGLNNWHPPLAARTRRGRMSALHLIWGCWPDRFFPKNSRPIIRPSLIWRVVQEHRKVSQCWRSFAYQCGRRMASVGLSFLTAAPHPAAVRFATPFHSTAIAERIGVLTASFTDAGGQFQSARAFHGPAPAGQYRRRNGRPMSSPACCPGHAEEVEAQTAALNGPELLMRWLRKRRLGHASRLRAIEPALDQYSQCRDSRASVRECAAGKQAQAEGRAQAAAGSDSPATNGQGEGLSMNCAAGV